MASVPKAVVLDYGPTGVKATPDPLEVVKGDQFVFQKGPDTQANAKIRVTISDPKFFSREVYNEGDPPVDVKLTLTGLVTYECDLVVAGQALPRVTSVGAGIKPG